MRLILIGFVVFAVWMPLFAQQNEIFTTNRVSELKVENITNNSIIFQKITADYMITNIKKDLSDMKKMLTNTAVVNLMDLRYFGVVMDAVITTNFKVDFKTNELDTLDKTYTNGIMLEKESVIRYEALVLSNAYLNNLFAYTLTNSEILSITNVKTIKELAIKWKVTIFTNQNSVVYEVSTNQNEILSNAITELEIIQISNSQQGSVVNQALSNVSLSVLTNKSSYKIEINTPTDSTAKKPIIPTGISLGYSFYAPNNAFMQTNYPWLMGITLNYDMDLAKILGLAEIGRYALVYNRLTMVVINNQKMGLSTGSASITEIQYGIGVKGYLLFGEALMPYARAGINFLLFNEYTAGLNEETVNKFYPSVGFDLGLGCSYYFSHNLSAFLDLHWHLNGIGSEDIGGLIFSMGFSYGF